MESAQEDNGQMGGWEGMGKGSRTNERRGLCISQKLAVERLRETSSRDTSSKCSL